MWCLGKLAPILAPAQVTSSCHQHTARCCCIARLDWLTYEGLNPAGTQGKQVLQLVWGPALLDNITKDSCFKRPCICRKAPTAEQLLLDIPHISCLRGLNGQAYHPVMQGFPMAQKQVCLSEYDIMNAQINTACRTQRNCKQLANTRPSPLSPCT
jgi:hypothetical protein